MKLSKRKIEDLERENQELCEQVTDSERLNRVLQTICSCRKVDEIVQLIIEEAISLCQADQGSILLFDRKKGDTAKTLVREGLAGTKLLDHYLNNLLGGWVQDNGILIAGALTEVFDEKLIKAKYRQVASVLSIPFVLQGEIIAVLNLISLRNKHKFGKREARLMETLVSQCVHFVMNARLHERLFSETNRLRKELQDKYSFHGFVGSSPQIQEVCSLLERIIPTEGRVIIEGESGTGKELIARILHYNGPRQDHPFVAVDCGALPANLLESELFGYIKGAFTGATADKKGLFEEANGGTLFLDEIVNMSIEIQSKFLRAIQENEIRRLGSTKVKKVDVRIITAASGVLSDSVKAGTFREDLFYRLNVVTVRLPPLRDRHGDIPVLADHFLREISTRYKKQLRSFKPETLALLESYTWPGNVRELENVIERCVILAESDLEFISPDLLPAEILPTTEESMVELEAASGIQQIKQEKASVEKTSLIKILEKHQWNQSSAARELGIHESTLRYKMQRLAICKPKDS